MIHSVCLQYAWFQSLTHCSLFLLQYLLLINLSTNHFTTTKSTLSSEAFVQAMEKYGFPGVSAFDIVETGKQVREEIAANDPEKAAAL